MAAGPLSIKLRCASWQQLATIYKRDLSRGSMFLKASTPPPIGTSVRIDLALPSASVIVLSGTVKQHLTDATRGQGVELELAPLPAGSVWMIESALAAEAKRQGDQPAPTTGATPLPSKRAATSPEITDGGDDMVHAEQDLVKALISEAESLRKLNPFLVLGVGYEATDADVRAAFGELTKRYHPDLFARYESTELRQTAAEIFILIRDAYRRLGDETGRAQALSSIGRPIATPRPLPMRAPTTPPVPAPANPPPRPSAKIPPPVPKATEKAPLETPTVKPAEFAVPEAALPTTPPAVTVRAPTSSHAASAATAPLTSPVKATESGGLSRKLIDGADNTEASPIEAMIDAGKLDEALAGYRTLSKKQPNDKSYRAGVELVEGLLALAQRDRLEAAQRFEAALEIDPSNERAARELADMRRQATNERKGLLTRLMGKKE